MKLYTSKTLRVLETPGFIIVNLDDGEKVYQRGRHFHHVKVGEKRMEILGRDGIPSRIFITDKVEKYERIGF